MRPTSQYLEALMAETYDGENHLGGSTPFVIPKIAKKSIQVSLDPKDYQPQLLKIKKHLAKATESDLDQISFVTSSTQACFQTLAAITDPGDTIVIEYPGYEPFLAASKFLNLNILRYHRSDDLDQDLKELQSLAKTAKVLLISNPHCPTGWTYSTKSLAKLIDLDLLVIIDEVFLPMLGKGAVSYKPSLPKSDNLIFISGLSKSTGLGFCRVGWILANKEISKNIHRVGLHLECRMPQPMLPVVETAFKNWKTIIKTLQKCAAGNGQPIVDFSKKHPGMLSNDFKKAFFGMVKVPPKFKTGEAFAAELLKHDILVRDGAYFEMPEWIRIHTLMPKKQFAKVFAKIASYY